MSARKFDLFAVNKRGGSECRFGNITVFNGASTSPEMGMGKYTKAYLHGNLVFELNRSNGKYRVDHCGWNTPTTRTAINNCLKQANINLSVMIRKGQIVLSHNLKPIDPNHIYHL